MTDLPKMRHGTKYIGEVPDWFDEDGRMEFHNFKLILIHPDHPPHYYDNEEKEWKEWKQK